MSLIPGEDSGQRTSIQRLPTPAIRTLKLVRQAAYVCLAPFDYLARAMKGKEGFPPLHLRRYVGPLRSFESSGAEFLGYLRKIARLRPDESILDIGCGCGLMALFLKDYLSSNGRYVGVDLHQPSIKWCRTSKGSLVPAARIEIERRYIENAYWPAG